MITTEVSVPTVIDRGAILDHFEGDIDLIREVIELFLAAFPRRLSAIREAILACDTKALQMSAHSLRGSASNFGAQALMAVALDLEMLGQDGNLLRAREVWATLEQEAALLKRGLVALLSCFVEKPSPCSSEDEEAGWDPPKGADRN